MKKTLVPIVALGAISLMADYVLDFSHKVENTNTRDTRVITDVNINSKNFTLEAWVYRTANQNGYKIFAQYPNTTGNYSLFLGGYDSQSGTLDVFLRGATGWWRPGVALPLGVWRHVALTKDDAGTVTLYTNGVQAATMSDESLKDFYPNQPGRKLWIGNSYSDGFGTEGTYTVGFPGHLCEMRYWNVARTRSRRTGIVGWMATRRASPAIGRSTRAGAIQSSTARPGSRLMCSARASGCVTRRCRS